VGIAMGWTVQGSSPRGSKGFLSSPKRPDQLWVTFSLLFFSPLVKGPWWEGGAGVEFTIHVHLVGGAVPLLSLYAFMAWTGRTSPF
jgi:hypothetical protein